MLHTLQTDTGSAITLFDKDNEWTYSWVWHVCDLSVCLVHPQPSVWEPLSRGVAWRHQTPSLQHHEAQEAVPPTSAWGVCLVRNHSNNQPQSMIRYSRACEDSIQQNLYLPWCAVCSKCLDSPRTAVTYVYSLSFAFSCCGGALSALSEDTQLRLFRGHNTNCSRNSARGPGCRFWLRCWSTATINLFLVSVVFMELWNSHRNYQSLKLSTFFGGNPTITPLLFFVEGFKWLVRPQGPHVLRLAWISY